MRDLYERVWDVVVEATFWVLVAALAVTAVTVLGDLVTLAAGTG